VRAVKQVVTDCIETDFEGLTKKDLQNLLKEINNELKN